MDFCIDVDISNLLTHNRFLAYLYGKCWFEPDLVYFVEKEDNQGYLIKNQQDLDSLQNLCRRRGDYNTQIIVKNDNIHDFRILAEKITDNSQDGIFEKTWTLRLIGNYPIDQINPELYIGTFSIIQEDQITYNIKYSVQISQISSDTSFTARAFNRSANSEFGPLLWVNLNKISLHSY